MNKHKPPKRALVLSGGAMMGAFQAGVIETLLERGFHPDTIMGISAGALNSSFLVNEAGKMNGNLDWPTIGNELTTFWLEQIKSPRDIVRQTGLLRLIWRLIIKRFNGILDYTPLVKLIQSRFDQTHFQNSPAELVVGAVDWINGDIEYPDQEHPRIIDFIIASASIPIILPYWSIEDRPYVDGGIRDVVPLKKLINKEIDEIVVVLTQPALLSKAKGKQKGNLIAFAGRVIELMLHEILLNDLASLNRINHELADLQASKQEPIGYLKGKRQIKCTIIRPEHPYHIHLNAFDQEDIQEMIVDGRRIAARAYQPSLAQAS